MRRPQFSIRTLLWLTLVAAAFLGGMAAQTQLYKYRMRRAQQEIYQDAMNGDGKLYRPTFEP